MVRARGLGWALGWAIGKALEGERRLTMIMMPQWRKLITFVLREVVTDVEGFPGGPHDTLVLRDFENYIGLRVWNGVVCKS